MLELSLREALQLGHNYIGTEHILLGLIREGEGVAAQVLVKLGADLSRVRRQVIELLSGFSGAEQRVDITAAPIEADVEPRCPRCGADLTEQAAYRMTAAGIALVFCLRCRRGPSARCGPRPAPAGASGTG